MLFWFLTVIIFFSYSSCWNHINNYDAGTLHPTNPDLWPPPPTLTASPCWLSKSRWIPTPPTFFLPGRKLARIVLLRRQSDPNFSSKQDLIGYIPTGLGFLTSLRRPNLPYNNFSNAIFPSFFNVLDLSHNTLSRFPPYSQKLNMLK